MEKKRGANGNAGGGGFDSGEAGVIIDDIVGQKYFLTPAPPHIQCGEIVQSTCGGNASEQQIVFLVPKVMLNWQAGGLRGFILPSLPVSVLRRSPRWFLSVQGLASAHEHQKCYEPY
jgi:hypothetical protein